MTTEQTDCEHIDYDEYFNKCFECGLEPEVCDECSMPLTTHQAEAQGEFVSKICNECEVDGSKPTVSGYEDELYSIQVKTKYYGDKYGD